MRVIIDLLRQELTEEAGVAPRVLPLYSADAYEVLSRHWLAVGWTQKYSYGFSWMGRPLIQLPEDVLRIQEVIHAVRPDVIVETGIAHGGSLIFYASLCKALERGRVIGVDIEIRPHNRAAIEAHPLAGYISLVEGNSTAPSVVAEVHARVEAGETVLVLLDSCHGKAHVLAELRAYASLVSKGSYIVATDGIMQDLVGTPGARPEWAWDNPQQAAREFVRGRPDFVLEEPTPPFNEGAVRQRVTYWPSAYLRRVA